MRLWGPQWVMAVREYSSVAEATAAVQTQVQDAGFLTQPIAQPALAVVVPQWTQALSGFEANTTVTPTAAARLSQLRAIYTEQQLWFDETARDLNIGRLNEHDPGRVLFMGLVRDFQARFAEKQNLNPHKLAVLLAERYEID